MKIYYVSIICNEHNAKLNTTEVECRSTTEGYVVKAKSNFSGKTTRVKKSQLLLVDSMVREDAYNIIHFYTWCLEADKKEAADKVTQAMVGKAEVINAATANIFHTAINFKP